MLRSTGLQRVLRFGAIGFAGVLAACSTLPRESYTATDAATAQVAGYDGIRVWGDGGRADFAAAHFWTPPPADGNRTLQYLALSGGGSAGAYGAGLLAGWTKSGTRPQFDIVTGVSTGALIAPFAFLGSAYDPTLEEIYTSGVAQGAAQRRWLPSGLLGSGILETEPFRKLIEHYATPELLHAIAAEHAKGRQLFVATTNIDSQRRVLWDMGKIAASGRPDSLGLFRQILIASASIPGGYEPELIDVTSGGRHFHEMHVDGATTSQVFTFPEGVMTGGPSRTMRANLYVVINNALMPEFVLTTNSTFGVLGRAYDTLIKAETRTALVATYQFTREHGMRFEMASIDKAVPYNFSDPFSLTYTRALYRLGYDEAASGRAWHSSPGADAPVAGGRT